MLTTAHIPQYRDEDHPEDWKRFLAKAAKGSCEAVDILRAAHLAYMAALTGDSHAPDEMPLDQYDAFFCERFPPEPPAKTPQELFDLAARHGYFPQTLSISAAPHLAAWTYRNLWTRRTSVPCDVLMNDAVLHCFSQWSPQMCLNSMDVDYSNYDSLSVVSGMLALSYTWPGAEQRGN